MDEAIEVGIGKVVEMDIDEAWARQGIPSLHLNSDMELSGSSGRIAESSKIKTFRKTCLGIAFVKKDLLRGSGKQILSIRYTEYMMPKGYYAVQGVMVDMSLQNACPWRSG